MLPKIYWWKEEENTQHNHLWQNVQNMYPHIYKHIRYFKENDIILWNNSTYPYDQIDWNECSARGISLPYIFVNFVFFTIFHSTWFFFCSPVVHWLVCSPFTLLQHRSLAALVNTSANRHVYRSHIRSKKTQENSCIWKKKMMNAHEGGNTNW